MHHFFEAITNTRGDSLVGAFGRVIDPDTLAVVPIYADNSGTAIDTISGVANMATTDSAGNMSFYVVPGTYNLDIYGVDAATFVLRVANVPMPGDGSDKAGTDTTNTFIAGTTVATADGGAQTIQNSATTASGIYAGVNPAGYYYYDNTRSVYKHESSATVQHGSAYGAYVYNGKAQGVAPNEGNAVGYWMIGIAEVNSARVWAINTALSDDPTNTPGVGTGRVLNGYEADFQINHTGTTVQGQSFIIQGSVSPSAATAVSVASGGPTAKWTTAYTVNDGAASNAFDIGALVASGTNIAGTPGYFSFYNGSGVRKQMGIQAVNGVLNFSCTDAATPDVLYIGAGSGNATVVASGSSSTINVQITPKGATGLAALHGADGSRKVAATTTGVGFHGTTPIAKPTVTGSRGANAALASLLTALASYGLVVDSSS